VRSFEARLRSAASAESCEDRFIVRVLIGAFTLMVALVNA
jgi:hypothetical protein